jgi:hypothetical protein
MLAGATMAYLAMSAIEPLYVACGFALYLNRRTQLEAWDIDLAFRRLRTRLQGLGKVLGVVLLCAGALPLTARAAAPAQASAKPVVTTVDKVFRQSPDNADASFAAAAAQTYRDPRFGGEHTQRRWVFKYAPKPARTQQASFPLLGSILAAVFKGLLWLALIAAAIALGWFAWRWRWRGRWTVEPGEPEQDLPPSLQAGIAAEAPLPADLAGAARALWQAQQRREALALLYRGCVEQTAHLLQLPSSADATEADWLRQAAAIEDTARAQRIIAIVRTWQFAAYAGRYPDDTAIEQLLSGWPAQPGAPA